MTGQVTIIKTGQTINKAEHTQGQGVRYLKREER